MSWPKLFFIGGIILVATSGDLKGDAFGMGILLLSLAFLTAIHGSNK